MADPRVAREFKAIEKKETEEERIKVFTSNPFKRGAVQFYARYVMIICKLFTASTGTTLINYICYNDFMHV